MGTAGDVLAVVQTDSSEKAISIWESENFFFDLEPLPGAVEAVKQMANLENTDVFICTSPIKRYKYCPYEKYAWVEKHLGPDFLEQVVLTRDKTVVSADLLIDDRPDITGKWPGQGPSPTPAGSTYSSQPATIGTCRCSPPAAGCSPGRTTGRPFWTASGPAEGTVLWAPPWRSGSRG
ncbi:5',3'-nucleotidase, mitochondrial [Phyllostomus discolor]|uniref:5',3'-nucleotidase, mitochondrial n=1 Tax=Phyllostomus discolor TaxID=89673 RepID=A0A833ZL79_9CHIR|nr:5',3'-nucleotidase, mitochondrial [Phyllostomus discolor]